MKKFGCFNHIGSFTILILALLGDVGTAEARSFSYPALDTASNWTFQDWGFSPAKGFYFQGAEKKVWTGPGQTQTKTVFYNLGVVGVRLAGTTFAFQGQDFMGEMKGDGYIGRYGSFKVTQDISLIVLAFFIDDGKFEINFYFSGPGYAGSQAWDIVLRMDYDLAGAGNNIAEFLWNKSSEGGTVSPPQYPRSEVSDGRLVYSYTKSAGSGYWSATTHEISVVYPPLARGSGSGVENTGFARILNAGNPQFGMVLWNDEVTPVEAVFKAYSGFDGNLWPQASIMSPLQNTGESGILPRYAFAGRDQIVFLVLNAPSGGGTYRVGGKLFQRANTRPLAVVVRQHPPETMDGFTFDPDRMLRSNSEGSQTFRTALAALAGENDFSVFRSGSDGIGYLPFDGYAAPGQAVTEAQLHNLLMNSRETSPVSLENVRDWRLDLLIVNWSLQGEPGVWEAMFDYGNSDANGISREGGVVFWPSMRGRNLDFQTRQATMSSLRAAGLSLNMDPSWGACSYVGYCWNDVTGCGGVRCGSGCPAGSQGCRYSAYDCLQECREGTIMSLVDVDRNTVGFNRATAVGSVFSEFDWYRKAPEAWVKPGRFGIPPISGPMPLFTPN